MKLFKNFLLAILGGVLFLSFNLLLPIISPAQNPDTNSRFATLAQADKLYLLEKRAEAEKLYRKVKLPFPKERANSLSQPVTEPEKLSPGGQTLWQNAQAGMKEGSESKTLESLKLLLEQHPEFLPAYLLSAEALQKYQTRDAAIEVLEQGVSLFPDSVDLTKALIKVLEEDKKWLDASITARQFAMVYPNHSEAANFSKTAEDDFDRFRRKLKRKTLFQGILGSAIGIVTGDRGERTVQLVALMVQGESGLGEKIAASVAQQTPLVTDPVVLDYVNKIGNDIANLMGRKDFKYEFNVVNNDALNAFALPGGKVFINTGILLAANSEAEFAGLLGHEIAHAVLSHGYERITKANLISNIDSVIPFGNVISTLVNLEYSRKNERQADVVGTRVLANAGYAADGLRNLFVEMKRQEKNRPPVYLSTHPATDDRIRDLEGLIQRNGYNRYAFEGVEKYAAIKKRLQDL